jgi:hypothetical protein
MRKTTASAIAGVALVLTLACAATPDTTSTSSTPGTTGQAVAQPAQAQPTKANTFNQPIGTTIVARSSKGTTEVTVTASKRQKNACKPTSLNKAESGAYVIIDVTVKITDGVGSINPLYFAYVDAGGTTISEAIFASCKDLGSGNDFPAGTVRSGQLAYDVATGPGTLSWSGVLGGQLGSWTIPA